MIRFLNSTIRSNGRVAVQKSRPHIGHPLQLTARRNPHTVVMIRHGESLWNLENRFTGWCDVPLTQNGELDAYDAGTLMGKRGLKFDIAFTSKLERAWRTCAIALAASGQSHVETIRSSFLNERHYGGESSCAYHKLYIKRALSFEIYLLFECHCMNSPTRPFEG